MEKIYNQLPTNINQKFSIIYSERKTEGITTFRNKELKFGALGNKNAILVEPIYDSIDYDVNLEIFTCVNFNKSEPKKSSSYFFFDKGGKAIAQFEGMDYMRFGEYDYCYFRKYKSSLWGVLDYTFQELILPKYQMITALSDSLFKVQLDGLWGIINKEDELIFDLKATEIIGDFQNPVVLAKVDGVYYQVNSDGDIVGDLPYTYIIFPSSNSYWWRFEKDKHIRKAILNGKNIGLEGYDMVDDLTEYAGKWGIVDTTGKTLIPPEYEFIDCLGLTDCYKVFKGNLAFVEDENYVTMLKGVKCGIVDIHHNTIIPIEYDWIEEVAENLWMVNIGGEVFFDDEPQEEYWKVRGGKFGVINHQNQMIVPIQYDTIMTSWYRIKDLILAQNGSTYFDASQTFDVYDLQGNQLDSSKINPKNHIYYNR